MKITERFHGLLQTPRPAETSPAEERDQLTCFVVTISARDHNGGAIDKTVDEYILNKYRPNRDECLAHATIRTSLTHENI
jgi:hypothetical protein